MAKFVNDKVVEFRKHYDKWKGCELCEIGKQASTHVLRVRGYIPCEIFFVGMAPGFSEDGSRGGFPMVGPTRNIIDEWIVESGVIGLRWAIQNIVACMSRDYGNHNKSRDPEVHEIDECRPRLIEIVRLCEPGQIVLLGKLAQDNFPKDMFSECQYLDLPHPAFLLNKHCRNPHEITARAILELKRFAFGPGHKVSY